MFWDNIGNWKDRPALCVRGNYTSYAQLELLCNSFSNQLPDKKTLVLVETNNSLESIVALYGSLRKGHAVMLYEHGNIELKQNLLKCFKPELIYVQKKNGWELRQKNLDCPPALHDDLALLLTTSGSTGDPKCVRLSKQNIQSNTEAISSYLSITESDRSLLLLPIHYCFGLSVLNTHLNSGACVHIQGPSADNNCFVPYLMEQNITNFSGVPHTFELLARKSFLEKSLWELKYIAQAGGRLPKDLVLAFDKWARNNRAKFYVMYGQAEASPRISYVPPSMLAENPDCIGIPISDGQLSLVDDDGHEILETEKEGELVYRGPNVMMGYAENSEDLCKGREIDALKTGDLGVRTQSNLFKVTGRKKRFCKIYGKRYNLDQIEQSLRAIDPSVVCLSNDISLFIAAENRKFKDLVALASSRFNISPVNIFTRHYTKIPVLTSGKTDYVTISKDFQNKNNGNKLANKRKVKESLLDIYRAAFPEYRVTKSDSFVSLGGDSLNYIAVSIDIEQLIGWLPDNWEKMTLEELAKIAVKRNSSYFSTIETGVFLRALSIISIVFHHSWASLIPDGGSLVLLLVAGCNFSRFHLDSLLRGNSKPILFNFTKNILFPYWAVLLIYNFVSRHGSGFHLEPGFVLDCLLVGNYYAVTELPFPTWFIQVLAQLIGFIVLTLLIPACRAYARERTKQYLLILLGLALMYRLIDSLWLMEMFPIKWIGQRTAWEAWIFLFGVLINRLTGYREKSIWTISLIILNITLWSGIGNVSGIVWMSLGGFFLVWKKNIPAPKILVQPIKVVSSASLYIYILHLTGFVLFFEQFGVLARICSGIIQGIIFWYLYNWLKIRFAKKSFILVDAGKP